MSFEKVFYSYLKGITDMHHSYRRMITGNSYRDANFIEIPLIDNDLKISVETYAKEKYIKHYKKDNLPMGDLQINLIDDDTFKTSIKNWLIDDQLEENSPYKRLFSNSCLVDINKKVTEDNSITIESFWENETEFEKEIFNFDKRIYINHYHTLVANEILKFLKDNLGTDIKIYSISDKDMISENTYISDFFYAWACYTFLIYNGKELYYLELCDSD